MKVQVLLKGYNFLFFGLLALFIPFLPVYLGEQGLSTSEIGIIIGTGGFVTLFAQPLWGFISDNYFSRLILQLIQEPLLPRPLSKLEKINQL